MKKRFSTRVICLLAALAMLTSALMVSAINGSPYETFKNAVLDAIFYDNVTIEGEFAFTIDGEVHESSWLIFQIGEDSTLSIDREESPWRGESRYNTTYTTQNLNIHSSLLSVDGTQWYSIRRTHTPRNNTSPGYELFGQAGRDSNQLRLVELLVDLFVGDLKNNLTISSNGDMRRVSGAITESQLPEIVRLLIDIGIEELGRWDDSRQRDEFRHVLEIPMRGLTIDRISGDADIDSDGNLRYVSGRGQATIVNMFNDTHVLEAEISLRFSDIGTTVPTSPFPYVEEIFSEELFREIAGRTTGILYFALDENGNIDMYSITDRWPGSRNTPVRTAQTTLTSTPSTVR
ncbi:MAG: hypothetical protein FWE42_01285 [Defluviitaleaceae bacterium]|nr:hypothetical protein [Defluviitaleaceae bacterium]